MALRTYTWNDIYHGPKKKKKKAKKVNQSPNREKWLKQHPEDIPLDQENMAARARGYDDDGLRALIAAVCLQTCNDYKNATCGKTYAKHLTPDTVIDDCRRAFKEDIFQFFVNGMKIDEIEKDIRAVPEGAIRSYILNNSGKLKKEVDING